MSISKTILSEERKKSEYLEKYKMDRQTLVIKSKQFQRKNIHQFSKDITGFKCTSKNNHDPIGFFRELNPLSNFHPYLFQHVGVKYSGG